MNHADNDAQFTETFHVSSKNGRPKIGLGGLPAFAKIKRRTARCTSAGSSSHAKSWQATARGGTRMCQPTISIMTRPMRCQSSVTRPARTIATSWTPRRTNGPTRFR
eukprot:620972-Prymnesium_polylepis.1